jgi:hypothetical protein
MTVSLIHGTVVSYRKETGDYGSFVPGQMLNPGLSTMFSVDVDETYEEIQFTPAHEEPNILEKVVNVKIGEELPFTLTTYPQKNAGWPLLQYVTGATDGLGDEPASTTWMKELNGKYSLFPGIMMEDVKVEIPGVGVVKESYTGFAGHRAAITDTAPDGITEAAKDDNRALVWSDISEIFMDDKAVPDTLIPHCISDISFGFTNEVVKFVHPNSTLSTKIYGVRVVSRKMFVTLKLGWVSDAFLAIVEGSTTQSLKFTLDGTTFIFGGLYFPKYVSKADPRELVGDNITSIMNKPTFTYA